MNSAATAMPPLELIICGPLLFLILLLMGKSLRRHAVTPALPKSTSTSPPDKTSDNQFPDPDPLLEFELKNATARNHVYVNKPLRYPYFQVRAGFFYVQGGCGAENRQWHTNPCTPMTGSKLIRILDGT
jgi:hypothetical protein